MTKNIKLPTLPNNNLTILDGGMGLELKRIGAPFSQPFWSAQALVEAPEKVTQAHNGFIDAGAQIIITNTYACVPFHIGDLYETDGARLIDLAGQCAAQARDQAKAQGKDIKIAGSIPPVLGSYRADLFNIADATPIIQTLVDNQKDVVDFWLAETISCIEEALLIHSMTRYTGKDIYMSFTVEDVVTDNPRFRSGEYVADAIKTFTRICPEFKGILFNCSSIEAIEPAIKTANQTLNELNWQIPIGGYANAFAPLPPEVEANTSDGTFKHREFTADEYFDYAQKWVNAGATIIGGCCGITPTHIAKLKDLQATQ